MKHSNILFAATSLFLFSTAAFGQHLLSVGVKGGVALSDAYNSSTITDRANNSVVRLFSNEKDYLVGPTVELHLPLGLSVEADALYRPLSLASQTGIPGSPLSKAGSTRVTTWEFPVLAKFRLPVPIAKPYVDAGPSFRHVGQLGDYLSSTGFAVGAGVELHAPLVRVSPEVRYTRWAGDSTPAGTGTFASSNLNQVELLVGFTF